MRVVNNGPKNVAFRDDAGKHILKPRQSAEVINDGHLPAILALPGIELVKPRPTR